MWRQLNRFPIYARRLLNCKLNLLMLALNSQDMARLKKWIMDDSTHTGSNCFALAMIYHGDEQGFLLDVNKSKAWRVEDIATDLGVV